MKKIWRHVISCIVVIGLLAVVLGYLTNLMERKSSYEKYAEFFDQEEDFDVLFMGTSHVINGIYPMELWNDYGIVSYNFGGHANAIPTTYWVLKNALDYTNPKLVVVDCWGLSSNIKGYDAFSLLHVSMDAFPVSITKIQGVWDLLNDPVMDARIKDGTTKQSDEPRTKIGLLWDYSVYHSRWSEIDEADFVPLPSREKGAESRINVSPGSLDKINSVKKFEQDSVGIEYINRIIETCQDRGIEVLLAYLPFPAEEQYQMEANRVYDIADEYGVNYINFLDLDVVDYQTDCYDADSHLNPSGARKVTDYLGKYITENYRIEDKRDVPAYSFWFEDYNEYVGLKNDNISVEESLMNYLMLLYGDHVDATLIVQNKDIYKNKLYLTLLGNLSVDIEELNDAADCIMIRDGGRETAVLNQFAGSENDCDEEMSILTEDIGMRCLVERNSTGERIDIVDFMYMVDPETGEVEILSAKR